MKLFFTDTETTGIPLYRERSVDPRQPYVTSLAGLLCDTDLNILCSFDCLIKPTGWTIPDDVVKAIGITTEMCEDIGVSHLAAMSMWKSMAESADLIVGHNAIQFDARMMRIMFQRAEKDAEWIEDKKFFCTMHESKDILQIPPTPAMVKSGRNWFKSPNLSESYKFFTKQEHQRAHTSMGDCLASRDVFRGIIAHKKIDIVAWTAERGTKRERKDEYAENQASKKSGAKKTAIPAEPASLPPPAKAPPAAKAKSAINW